MIGSQESSAKLTAGQAVRRMEREFIDVAARVMWSEAWWDVIDLLCHRCPFDGNVQHEGSSIEGAHELWLLETDRDMHPFVPGTHGYDDAPAESVAPATPLYAQLAAARFLGKLEQANGCTLADETTGPLRVVTLRSRSRRMTDLLTSIVTDSVCIGNVGRKNLNFPNWYVVGAPLDGGPPIPKEFPKWDGVRWDFTQDFGEIEDDPDHRRYLDGITGRGAGE